MSSHNSNGSFAEFIMQKNDSSYSQMSQAENIKEYPLEEDKLWK